MPKQPDTPFGRLMREGLKRTGISQGKLGGRISDFQNGPIYDASAIRMLMAGQRRLNHKIVTEIIDILGLDWAEAWAASGLLPPDVSAADLEVIQAHRRRRGDRQLDSLAATGAVSDQQRGATSGYLLFPAHLDTSNESGQLAQLAEAAA
jgi:hypothetical protein